MYERSAIVLERYFEKLLGFNEENNLKKNFKNYCDLFKKFNIFQEANSEEFEALAQFQDAESSIEEIQTSQEKLYKKNAKLEYNRDLLFADITQKPEEIEKCIVKLENDIAKNQSNLVTLREKFIEAIRDYNEKKSKLNKCKKNRRNAEADYNAIFEATKQNLENIQEEYVEIAKNFVTEENKLELISIMADNGKEEKIPFNNSVITAAAQLGFDILQREVECYLLAYDMTNKLIKELQEGAVSVELHQKTVRNINAKLHFLNAQKEYLIQFLDYERITVIYGKRTHRTLMQEACEKFELDIVQVNNLYELLLKEIAGKSTKKAYKELYNKSYLIDIEEKDAKFKKEKNKMNLPVGTIMNSNYWRIEGIKNIYTVFYKEVSEVFGRDLVEFDLPKEQDIEEIVATENTEEAEKSVISENVEQTVEILEEITNISEISAETAEDIANVSAIIAEATEDIVNVQEITTEAAEDPDSTEEIVTEIVEDTVNAQEIVAEIEEDTDNVVEAVTETAETGENIEEAVIEEFIDSENTSKIEVLEEKVQEISVEVPEAQELREIVTEIEEAQAAKDNIDEIVEIMQEPAEETVDIESVSEIEINTDLVEEIKEEKKASKKAKKKKIYKRKITILPENIQVIENATNIQKEKVEEFEAVIEEPKIIEKNKKESKKQEKKKIKEDKKENKKQEKNKKKADKNEKLEIEPIDKKLSIHEIEENSEAQETEKIPEEIIEIAETNEIPDIVEIKEEKETSLFEDITEDENREYNSFDEKYKDIEKQIAELDELDDLAIDVKDMLEDTPYESDDMFFDEDSIFGDIENKEYEELSLKKDKKSKAKKKGIFGKIININSKSKKEVNS